MENFKYLNVGLRQPLSSLLSKQSGNPSHCHPPGTHFPSAHMKFPGMLHSVVALLPGSSWLSDGEEKNTLLRLYSNKNNMYRNAVFPFGWGLTLCSKWISSWPKTTLGSKDERGRFRPLYYTWNESKGVKSEAECHCEVITLWESVQLTLVADGGSELQLPGDATNCAPAGKKAMALQLKHKQI